MDVDQPRRLSSAATPERNDITNQTSRILGIASKNPAYSKLPPLKRKKQNHEKASKSRGLDPRSGRKRKSPPRDRPQGMRTNKSLGSAADCIATVCISSIRPAPRPSSSLFRPTARRALVKLSYRFREREPWSRARGLSAAAAAAAVRLQEKSEKGKSMYAQKAEKRDREWEARGKPKGKRGG